MRVYPLEKYWLDVDHQHVGAFAPCIDRRDRKHLHAFKLLECESYSKYVISFYQCRRCGFLYSKEREK